MPARVGALIAIEGVEGAGKSTQATRLAAFLGAELTREPGGTQLGEAVRALLLGPETGEIAPLSELFLLLAARAEHVTERITPALSAGRHVVVDRFTGSTIAYQAHGRGLPLSEVRRACEIAAGGVAADLNLLLDVPVPTGAARRRATPDRIEAESDEFHERVRAGFLAEAAEDTDHWAVVDGTRPVEVVASELAAVVAGRLGIVPAPAR